MWGRARCIGGDAMCIALVDDTPQRMMWRKLAPAMRQIRNEIWFLF
jgi:hypothetical protein